MLTKSDKNYLQEHVVTIELFSETMKEIATREELKDLENRLITLEAGQSQIIGMLSGIAGELQDKREETITFGYRQSEHTTTLEKHDKQILRIEKNLGLAEFTPAV